MVNSTHPKIICVPGSGNPTDGMASRTGFNPYWVEPPFPKQKIVKRKKLTPEKIRAIRRWHEYDKHKDDMKVLGFAMGPDFKTDYVNYETVEAVDFYQIFTFLMRIPSGKHSGKWDRVRHFLTISGADGLNVNVALFVAMIMHAVIQF